MREFYITTEELKEKASKLSVGDKVYLSGKVYTARDAAHKRIFELIESGSPLPFDISGAVIYYAGPTPTPPDLPIGSCGPTTSSRMDPYTKKLHEMGLVATIGKGGRNKEVTDSIKENRALYLCAIGGAGALAATCITDCKVIAFDELGCESVKELTFNNFPLIVGIDTDGNSIFNR